MQKLSVLLLLMVVACSRSIGMATYAPKIATIVIRDVDVFSGVETSVTKHQDVWIEDGLITRIIPTGGMAIPSNARVIDGNGYTVLPGLIDIHTHITGFANPLWKLDWPNPVLNLEKYLYAGVTTVFDLGGGLGKLSLLRNNLRQGKLVGPDLYFSGPVIGPKDGHPAAVINLVLPWPLNFFFRRDLSFEVATKRDIDSALADLLKAGADLVKVVIDELPLNTPTLSQDLLNYAVKRAHDLGYLVVAHVGDSQNAIAAVAAGVDVFVHNVYRDRLSIATATALAAANIGVAPTIGVFHITDLLSHEGPYDWLAIEREVMGSQLITMLENRPSNFKTPAAMQSWEAANHQHRQTRFDNAQMLRQAGVQLLVGSDSVIAGWDAGASLHREMLHLVQAGFTPAQVLQAATYNNARRLQLNDRGVVAIGKRADLLVVEGDPTQNITRLGKIRAVIRGGREVLRLAKH